MNISRRMLGHLSLNLSLIAGFAYGTGTPAQSPAALPPHPPAETKFFPLSDIHKGLNGVAYTVFEGVTPEPMAVEILGVLKNAIGPGQDMILARLHGARPEYTGVVAGMSGSPVYIDGRLAGALSYRIGSFSKEPIAGITPIEQMLQVRDHQSTTPVNTKAASESQPQLTPMETPLTLGGFSQQAVDQFGDRFRALGLVPVIGLGGQDSDARQPEPLEPGSAVSAVLVRGDLSMSGTCTVTYIDSKQLMACGHPITQFGAVSMPMTKATVLATLASPLNAFKIINTTETVGSFTEDRASAILGHFGETARMIPVTVEVKPLGAAPAHTYRFEVLNNRELTPNALLISVFQSIQGTNNSAFENSYRVAGELSVAGQPPIHMSGLMSPSDLTSGSIATALFVNERFSRIFDNPQQEPVITGLNLHVETLADRRTAVIESARASQTEAHPGDTIEIEATIRPYQQPARVVRLPIQLPASLSEGQLRIVVSDAATVDRLTQPGAGLGSAHTESLADTVARLNRMHPNDHLYATILPHNPQALLESGPLPGLPVSMANVLEPLKQTQQMQLNGESATTLSSTPVDAALSGSQVVTLTIR